MAAPNLLLYLRTHEDAFKSPSRLPSLYSAFHDHRHTNPEGYAANAAAWTHALRALLLSGQLPSCVVLSASTLPRALAARDFGPPQALGAVLRDALDAGALVPLGAFLRGEKSVYAPKGWGLPGPGAVVGWGLRVLGLSGRQEGIVDGEYVLLAAVEEVGKAVLADVQTASEGQGAVVGRVWERSMFEERFLRHEGAALGKTDREVLLRWMSRDKDALVYNAAAVKVHPPAGRRDEERSITAQDESVANLRLLIHTLHAQIPALEARVDELTLQARAAVAKKDERAAKAALRRKRAIEDTLRARLDTLDTLEGTMGKIEEAGDNVAVVEAMRGSREVLRVLNERVGGAEGVQGVVDGLRDEMDRVGEVQSVVLNAGPAVDEDEVERELEGLEREKRDGEEREAEAKRKDEAERERTLREERVRLQLLELESAPQAAPGSERADAEAQQSAEDKAQPAEKALT